MDDRGITLQEELLKFRDSENLVAVVVHTAVDSEYLQAYDQHVYNFRYSKGKGAWYRMDDSEQEI